MNREIDPYAFGARVQARRKTLDMTQTELADAIGMRQQGVGAIEAGEVQRPRKIDEIAAALKTSKEWLWWAVPPEEALPSSAPQPDDPPPFTYVPLLDSVTAGRLSAPESQIPVEKVPLLAYADLGPGEWFATRVDGTSMNRVSPEGSVILINRRDRTLISGKPYLFGYKGETTYKLWQAGDPAYLRPYSTEEIHEPIFVRNRKRDFEVIGRVKRTVLDL